VQDQLVELLPRLRRFARSLTGSAHAADDLVQIACERLLARASDAEPIVCLESWLYRVIRNAWIDNRRSPHHRQGEPLEAGLEVVGEDGERTVDTRSTLARVRLEIARLPEEQRSVLMLVCVNGLSYAATAESLKIPIGTVMSRLARGRLALAQAVGLTPSPRRGDLGSSAKTRAASERWLAA